MRIFILRKRYLLLCLGAVLTAAIFFAVNALPATVAVSATTRQLPIYCVDRSDNLVSISFDAAWGDTILRHHLNRSPF